MKSILFLLFIGCGIQSYAQNCEQIFKSCELLLKEGTKSPFISDGQVYSAFLDREKAEFNTTFYGGSTYRIAASAGNDNNYVIFTVKDELGNILFTNKTHKNAPYWDFKTPSTINITIEVELDPDMKVTGCAVMLIGFRN